MCADVTSGDALSAEDLRILGLETPRVAGHTLKVMALEPDGGLELDELRAWVGARVERLPRLTQRLDPHGRSWIPDDAFHVDRHVRRAEDAGSLPAAVAAIMERRLDRDAPLWEIELADDAVVLKVHHAMADGSGARRIASVLLWDSGDPAPAPARARAPAPETHGHWMRE